MGESGEEKGKEIGGMLDLVILEETLELLRGDMAFVEGVYLEEQVDQVEVIPEGKHLFGPI